MDSTTLSALNASNATGGRGGFAPRRDLVLGNQININITLCLIMIAMGCTMTIKDIKKIVTRPVAITVGALCQFGIMPTLGFALAHLFKLTPNMAIGTIIVSCCPGGLASNFFTYWMEGDVTLSVCMTTASTILGIGMMPLCIYLYTQSWVSLSTAVVPSYIDIIIALVVLLVPAGIGMLIQWRAPKAAEKIALVLNIVVNAGLVVFLVITSIAFTPIFKSSWRPYAVAFLYPFIAFIFGYGVAWIFRRNKHQCRTIAFETGVQNTALALSLINFLILQRQGSGQAVGEMMIVPTIHGFAVLSEGFFIIGMYWVYKKAILKEKGFASYNKADKEDKILEMNGKGDEEKKAVKAGFDNPWMITTRQGMVDQGIQTDFPSDY
ncbi:ileal sodium/bile acid cotransporter-like [Glandiceps talaboti]